MDPSDPIKLDRQEIPQRPSSRPQPPQRLPESTPPLLGDWFIYLSIIVLVCGVIAITALNLGSTVTDSIVRAPALIAAGLLVVLSADACLRAWRSAWAWLPVDRPRGLARFVWTAVTGGVVIACIVGVFLLVAA